jgi:prepilin-type N-terminal cleavage/methylation domain-containing protein
MRTRGSQRPVYCSCPSGMTLIELLLVLAILVLVAAISLPSLRGTLRNQQLTRAGDLVRIEWARAHVQAMKTGRIQMFRYQVGGQGFRVEPWAAGDDMLESATPQDASGMNPLAAPAGFGASAGNPQQQLPPNIKVDESGNPESDRYRLPEEITFAVGDARNESRALKIEQTIVETERSVEWSRPILFYPDGSTSDAFVIVASPQQVGVRVELRGLTGTATVSEIAAVDELTAETSSQ